MLLTGGLLNATTVLQPQFLQQQLGYTATIAGLSLSGGGLVLLIAMPMAGQAVSRFPARNLIAFGFVIFAIGYFYTAKNLSLLISFGFASKLRVVQIIAIPFVFISVTTAAYFGIPPEKNNQVSGLINFVRNIGGSILISLTNALVTERAQWHQSTLSKNTTLAGSIYQQQIDSLRHTFDMTAGKANGLQLAQGQLYNHLIAQTQALAYVDVYYVLCFAAILMVPMAFLLDRNQPGGGGSVMME
jgi:DHA2 family multidrug resistance protein